jgi:hypothetical protein
MAVHNPEELERLKADRRAEAAATAGQSLRDQIGKIKLGAVEFAIFRGQSYTINEMQSRMTDNLTEAYRSLTKDRREFIPRELLERVIGSALIDAWYEFTPDREPRPEGTERRAEIVKTAKDVDTSVVVETGKKGKARETVASVIREGLRRKMDTDVILKEVKARFPDSKAGPRDVAYYRHKLKHEVDSKEAAAKRMEYEKGRRTKTGRKKKG